MKVAVVNTAVPFLRGGAEILADGLARALLHAGHEVAEVKVPLRWNSAEAVAESMVSATLITLADADVVIPLKFPAYLIEHHHKTIWLLHQFRQVYDFWGTEHQGFPDNDETTALRDAIRTGIEPKSGMHLGLDVVRIIEAVDLSLQEGGVPVTVDRSFSADLTP